MLEVLVSNIHFPESPEETVEQLVIGSKVLNVVHLMQENKEVPDDVKEEVVRLLNFFTDLVSLEIPNDSDKTPEEVLITVANTFQFSRVLKEKAMLRFYLLLNRTTTLEIKDEYDNIIETAILPIYMTMTDEYGRKFTLQEDFIKWFCESAGVSRALVFQSKAVYDRLINSLGYTIEESYYLYTRKPSTIRKVLKSIARWKGNTIISIDPVAAYNIVNKYYYGEDKSNAVELISQYEETGYLDDLEEVVDVLTPAFRSIIEEVAEHERASEAMKFVDHDLLLTPEISYSIDWDLQALTVDYVIKGVDQDGNEYIADADMFSFLPDTTKAIPEKVLENMAMKLSIRDTRDI